MHKPKSGVAAAGVAYVPFGLTSPALGITTVTVALNFENWILLYFAEQPEREAKQQVRHDAALIFRKKSEFLYELWSVVYVAENGIGDPMAMMRSLVKVTSPKNGGWRSWWNSNVICTQDHCKVSF